MKRFTFEAFARPAALVVVLAVPCLVASRADSIPEPSIQISTVDSSEPDSEAVDTLPVLRIFVKAEYPARLIAQGKEGTVGLDLLVDSTGRVESAEIVGPLHPALDSAARQACLRFQFSPAIKDGRPVAVVIRYEYRFSIDEIPITSPEQTNLLGQVFRRGTREPLGQVAIAIVFVDTLQSNRRHNPIQVDSLPDGIPLDLYLRRIGGYAGQRLENGCLIVETDSGGKFSCKSLPNGTLGIRIMQPGYHPYDGRVTISQGKVTEANYYLQPEIEGSYEIVVYGKQEKEEVAQRIIDRQEIRKVPGFNGEAVKVVQALPGVARPVMGQGELVIRGADNDDSKVLFDGIEIPYLYHPASRDFMLDRSIINGDALSSVTLYPGGQGVRYGNVLGGVVDLTSRPARADRFHGIMDVNLKGYSLLLESPITKNVSLLGSLRGTFLSLVSDFIAERLLHERMDYKAYDVDYFVRCDYAPIKGHRIFVESIGAKDTIYNAQQEWITSREITDEERAIKFGLKFYQGIAGWDWDLGKGKKNQLRLALRRRYLDSFNNMSDWAPRQRGHETTYDVREEFTTPVSERLDIGVGLDLHLTPIDGSDSYVYFDTTVSRNVDLTLGHAGIYSFLTWKPIAPLSVTTGLRFDRYPQLEYHGVWFPEFWDYSFDNTTRFSGDPTLRISARYEIDKSRSLTASAGTYSQSPDTMALLLEDRTGLLSQKGSQYTLGYEWSLDDHHAIDVEAYYNRQWDIFRRLTAKELAERVSNGEPFDWWACDGRARMTGLELMLRRSPGTRFSGWLAYSLGLSQRYDEHERDWVLFDYNVLNNVQLVLNYALTAKQNIGLRAQYTEGYPYTPRKVQYYHATYLSYQSSSGEKNSERYPPYVGIDLSYAKKWLLKKSTITTYLELMRVLHLLQYVKKRDGSPVYEPFEAYDYNYDFSSFEGFPMFPMASFGLTWEF